MYIQDFHKETVNVYQIIVIYYSAILYKFIIFCNISTK